jgi:hypothetical protein
VLQARADEVIEETLLAAVHESVPGTFETCRRTVKMSLHGVPEVTGRRSERRE